MSNTNLCEDSADIGLTRYKKRIACLEEDLKLAKSKTSIHEMQMSTGVPKLTGQAIPALDAFKQPCLGTNISIRLVTPCSPYYSPESDDVSVAAWNEVNWSEPDWKHADQQVEKAARGILLPKAFK